RMDKDELGRRGEEIAAAHLRDNGFEILDRNWRVGRDVGPGSSDAAGGGYATSRRDPRCLKTRPAEPRIRESSGAGWGSGHRVSMRRRRRLRDQQGVRSLPRQRPTRRARAPWGARTPCGRAPRR
ncbi:hypothetical protein C5B98_15010, partial [Rathayibacter sp. AY1A5]